MLLSKQSNKIGNFIILLLLSILVLAGSIIISIRDFNIDLSKADTVTGKVEYTDLQNMKFSGSRFDSYKLIFYFRLENSNQNFAVYHSSALYDNLTSNIKIGDSLKVIYRPVYKDYNTHVFQIEKDSQVIEDYKEYKKQNSSYAGMGIFFGALILIGSIMWYKKISLYKILTSWVER